MTPFEKLDRFLRNLYETAFYFAVMAVKENFRNYVGRAGTSGTPRGTMAILGNGPSLAAELPELLRDPGDRDFMAVNYFALDERFTLLRPSYYVLSDPMFFRDSPLRDRVAELYRVMNERVAWPMTLYVQYYNPERFDYRAALPNPLIRIVPFHTTLFRGFRSLEFRLFRRGLGSANFGTVVQVGEYIALLLGYRRVELYGVDHPLLEGVYPPNPYPIEFVKVAAWRTTAEKVALLEAAGFGDLTFAQTLTSHPLCSNDEEEQPVEGYGKGDYVAVTARKCVKP